MLTVLGRVAIGLGALGVLTGLLLFFRAQPDAFVREWNWPLLIVAASCVGTGLVLTLLGAMADRMASAANEALGYLSTVAKEALKQREHLARIALIQTRPNLRGRLSTEHGEEVGAAAFLYMLDNAGAGRDINETMCVARAKGEKAERDRLSGR